MKLPRLQPLVLRASRALLLYSLRPEIRRRLRGIFRVADAEVPKALVRGAAPVAIEGILAQAIKYATCAEPTNDEVQVVAALYDVMAAAIPLSRR
jgi:hypothetical protein